MQSSELIARVTPLCALLMLATCMIDRQGQLFSDESAGSDGSGSGANGSGANGSGASGSGASGSGGSPAVTSVSSSTASAGNLTNGAGGSGGAGGVGIGGAATGGSGGTGGGPGDWWDPDWDRRVSLTFDNSASAIDLSDFPALVKIDGLKIDYADTEAGGIDVRFIDADGSTELDYEIESWNPAGASYLWVRVPTIDALSTTDQIWMYYGNAAASGAQDASGVWEADYAAVWHLDETVTDEGTAGVHVDSTGNGNDGSQVGNDDVNDTTGSIAGAQHFDGDDDHIDVPQAGLQIAGNEITIQVRAYIISEPNQFPHVFGAGADGRYWQLYWEQNRWAGRYRVDGMSHVIFSNQGMEQTWETVALAYDGSAVRLYRNGVEIGTDAATGDLDALTTSFFIGGNPILSPRDFDGYVDEVRIASVARPVDWLEAQHASLTDALITYGAVESN